MRRIVATTVSALACCVILFTAGAPGDVSALAQKQRRRPTPARRPPAIDYSRFFHSTPKHRGACNTCHEVPTDNWKKVRGFPDVADYPDHDACVSCHRPQFFKGAKPPICSVCHSKVSPRDDARFAFRNPASSFQFQIEFPHDKHQDVIAKAREPVTQTVSLRAWSHPDRLLFSRRKLTVCVTRFPSRQRSVTTTARSATARARPRPSYPQGFGPIRLSPTLLLSRTFRPATLPVSIVTGRRSSQPVRIAPVVISSPTNLCPATTRPNAFQ